jgi:hypothetical protein
VYETFSKAEVPEIVTFRYGKEDDAVRNFKATSKAELNKMTIELMTHELTITVGDWFLSGANYHSY